MKLQVTSALAALLLSGASASALDFGNGFSLTGDIELEYFQRNDNLNSTYALADLTLGWRSQGGGDIGFGFDLSHVLNDEHNDDSVYRMTWGGLVVTTEFGELTIGRPRPLLDTLSQVPTVGALDSYSLPMREVHGSYFAMVQIYESDLNTFGATFKGNAGQFSYGVGIHRIGYSGDTGNVFELTGSYKTGAVLVYAGMEQFPESIVMAPERRMTLGVTYDADRLSVGAEAVRTDYFGSGGLTAYLAFGDYDVTEHLTVGLQYLDSGETWADPFFGMSGSYSFANGAYAELGYLDDGFSDKTIWSASIGFSF